MKSVFLILSAALRCYVDFHDSTDFSRLKSKYAKFPAKNRASVAVDFLVAKQVLRLKGHSDNRPYLIKNITTNVDLIHL